MAGYVSLFDLGESRDDVEVDYNSLHHYRVNPICRLSRFSQNQKRMLMACRLYQAMVFSNGAQWG